MPKNHQALAIDVLTSHGWTAEGGTAIASKTYDTAVGTKTAPD